MLKVHTDERGKKYIDRAELVAATGISVNSPIREDMPSGHTARQQSQTDHTPVSDNTATAVDAMVLQARLDGMEALLQAKDEMIRMKDEQLQEWKVREAFYQGEINTARFVGALQAVQFLAPASGKSKTVIEVDEKKGKWYWPFRQKNP